MNKLHEIVDAWAATVNPEPERKALAELRYAVCTECEFRKTNAVGLEVCGACGCPLKAKVFTRLTPDQGNCPKNKWKV